MKKSREWFTNFHSTIRGINFILLKRKFLTYSVMGILFAMALFFLIYMPYSYKTSQIKVMNSSLYRLESNIRELHSLEKEMNERENILEKLLSEFKKNSISYSKEENIISFNPGYLRYDTFLGLLSAVEKTGFLKILSLEITNLNGNEPHIIEPNKYIYLKEFVIYSNARVKK